VLQAAGEKDEFKRLGLIAAFFVSGHVTNVRTRE
jgi:hypothetical protein